jgi:hypothetical protein
MQTAWGMHGMQCVLDSADHKGTGVVVQHDIPCKHSGTFSVDGGMKVSRLRCALTGMSASLNVMLSAQDIQRRQGHSGEVVPTAV